MSDQLEPELERVARMLASVGPLPDAPDTLRERALAIPDGGPVADADLAAVAPRRERRRPRVFALAGVAAAIAAIAIVPAACSRRAAAMSAAASSSRRTVRAEGRRQRARRRTQRRQRDDRAEGVEAAGQGTGLRGLARTTGDRSPLGQFRIGNDGKATVTYTVPRGGLAGYRWLWVTSGPAVSGEQPSRRRPRCGGRPSVLSRRG